MIDSCGCAFAHGSQWHRFDEDAVEQPPQDAPVGLPLGWAALARYPASSIAANAAAVEAELEVSTCARPTETERTEIPGVACNARVTA